MKKLLEGLHRFQQDWFSPRQEFFARLADGQHPETLFITCSDSRINPNLLTQTGPGDLFILRNAGNLVPRHGEGSSGEEATIEYAVKALGVREIVMCGHSHCGAMKALLNPSDTDSLPSVRAWLEHAKATRAFMDEHHPELEGPARLLATVQANVLVQLDHLRSLPAVAEALEAHQLRLYGWVYHLETGDVQEFDPKLGQFRSLGAPSPVAAPPSARAIDPKGFSI